jgi:hypothetical protein
MEETNMNEARWRKHVTRIAAQRIGIAETSPAYNDMLKVYNDHKPLARGYRLKPRDPWCAAFVSVVAILADCTDIIPTEVSCGEMLKAFRASGNYTENDDHVPNPGDVIFYNWDNAPQDGENVGYPDHVGIVHEVRDGVIDITEGNFSNMVKARLIAVGDPRIRGYGLPDYKSKATPESVDDIAAQVLEGKWGNNPERRERLIAAGYDYDAVQKRVNELVEINAVALEVIEGKWGNNPERREKLQKAGFDYDAIQKRVNEILGE